MELLGKLMTPEAMVAERERLRAAGRTVVFTNGCFDLIHRGHVSYLGFARGLGDVLIVGINSDASVRRNKGPERPVVSQEDRAYLLLALRCVDYVVIFDSDTPLALIQSLLPDILVKGRDWAHLVVGREVVEANGGKVVLADVVEGYSTTRIIERVMSKPANGTS